MATRTVKPSGGDYTTLSAWEAGRQGDLTGLGPEIAECSGNLSDTTAVTIDGWTTTATDYIQIITPQADRHAGAWDTTKYRLEASVIFSRVLRILEDFVRLEGLQLAQTNTTTDAYEAVEYTGSANNSAVGLIDACIIKSVSTNTANGNAVIIQNTQGTYTLRNSVLYTTGSDALNCSIAFVGTRACNIDNCTLIGTTYGLESGAYDTITVRNTYAHGGTDAYTGSGITRTTCAHSSATSFTGSTASIAHSTANFISVTGGSQDYHLQSGASATLLTGGTDLSGTFTVDIDNQTRVDWGIGADEYINSARRFILVRP